MRLRRRKQTQCPSQRGDTGDEIEACNDLQGNSLLRAAPERSTSQASTIGDSLPRGARQAGQKQGGEKCWRVVPDRLGVYLFAVLVEVQLVWDAVTDPMA